MRASTESKDFKIMPKNLNLIDWNINKKSLQPILNHNS